MSNVKAHMMLYVINHNVTVDDLTASTICYLPTSRPRKTVGGRTQRLMFRCVRETVVVEQ